MAGLIEKAPLTSYNKDMAYSPFSKVGKFRAPGLPRPGAEGKPKIRRLIEQGPKGLGNEEDENTYHPTNLLRPRKGL